MHPPERNSLVPHDTFEPCLSLVHGIAQREIWRSLAPLRPFARASSTSCSAAQPHFFFLTVCSNLRGRPTDLALVSHWGERPHCRSRVPTRTTVTQDQRSNRQVRHAPHTQTQITQGPCHFLMRAGMHDTFSGSDCCVGRRASRRRRTFEALRMPPPAIFHPIPAVVCLTFSIWQGFVLQYRCSMTLACPTDRERCRGGGNQTSWLTANFPTSTIGGLGWKPTCLLQQGSELQPRKMARGPAAAAPTAEGCRPKSIGCRKGPGQCEPRAPEDGANASAAGRALQTEAPLPLPPQGRFQQPLGPAAFSSWGGALQRSPCPNADSTRPSCRATSPPASLRSPRRSRRAAVPWCRSHPPQGGSPSPCSGSTTSSCPRTTPPSNWHSPPCNRRAAAAAPVQGARSPAPVGGIPCPCAGSTRFATDQLAHQVP